MRIPPRSVIHFLFGGYAGGLFVGTHWPKVRIVGPIERPDIVIHIAVFGIWAGLMIACGLFGPRLSARNIMISTLISIVYAGLDEALQAVPMLYRVASWDDFAANAAGVMLAALIAAAIGWKARRG